ncbi:MAG: heat-inducible transcriptional repressor HrcA [Sphingomonadaceae bacterium]
MELTARQQAILKQVVEDYVLSAVPIPSDRIAGRAGLKVSSATVRNEMMELEELGLLTHPHTSAGRVPSDLGYRYYIEHLMTERGLTEMEEQMVAHQFHQVEAEVEEWGPLAAAVLAQMARTAALATKLHSLKNRVKRVELVSVQDDLVLVVLILRSGGLQQRLIRMDEPVARDELTRIANKLSDLLADQTSSQVARRVPTLVGLEQAFGSVVAKLIEQSETNWSDTIYYEGISFVSGEPEFDRAERLMQLMKVLHRGSALAPLFADVLDSGGLRVVIGRENETEEMRGCSMVLTRYGLTGEAAGVVGVVGPTRMRYWRAVSLVRFMASLLDRLVEQSLR